MLSFRGILLENGLTSLSFVICYGKSIFCIVQEWKSQLDGGGFKGIDECIDIFLIEIEQVARDSVNKKIGGLFSGELQPKDSLQRFPMDLKIMTYYLKD